MGKWFNHKVFKQHTEDLKYVKEDIKDIYPHVLKVAQAFPRDSIAIGTLDLNDLVQAGHEGLWRGWLKVDWDRIRESSNPQGELWSFLKKRIKWSIRREIDKNAQHVSVPINKQESVRNRLGNMYEEKVITNIFPKFFDYEIIVSYDYEPWVSVQLEEIIDNHLEKYVKNVDHRDIMKKFYGVGFEKRSTKELAEEYNKLPNAISQIINTVKNKLKTNELENIIENFYKNQ